MRWDCAGALLGAAMSEMKPVVDELGTKACICIVRSSCAKVERVPCDVVPDLIGPLVLVLEKRSMSSKSNFLADDRHIVRRNDMLTVGNFNMLQYCGDGDALFNEFILSISDEAFLLLIL